MVGVVSLISYQIPTSLEPTLSHRCEAANHPWERVSRTVAEVMLLFGG